MAKKKNLTKVIDIGPQLIVDNIKGIYKHYLKTFSETTDSIEIKTKVLENIDLSGIQFLLFAQEHSKKNNKTLKINLTYSEVAKELITKSGFTNFLSA